MAKTETVMKLKNMTKNVIVAGQVRIKPGAVLEMPESKCSEGLKRLIGKELKKV